MEFVFYQAKYIHMIFKFHTVFHYHLDDTIISQVEVQRDLGLMILT